LLQGFIQDSGVVIMGGKRSFIWIWLVVIIFMAAFLNSCSQVSPSQNITFYPDTESSPDVKSSPELVGLTTKQMTASETLNSNDQDLNRFVKVDSAETVDWKFTLTTVENLHVTGTPQDVDITSYRLTVEGLLNTPLVLSYEELLRFTSFTRVVTLECPEYFVDIAEWTGVSIITLLNIAGIKPGASEVSFYSLDGYSQTLSLQNAQKEGVFLAYNVNGQVLPKEHGYPLRLIVDGEYGGSWVKWVNRIEVK
jgi:DMSO/TMAO reductase YedYZ molybdopterin-dependent catalytic subunit